MKQIIYKITSFSLALIVLFSSFSFTVNKHICGGKVANIALFVSADNCGMDMQVCKNDTSKKQTSLDKEPCCNDISEFVQGNDTNQQASVLELSVAQLEFLTYYVYLFVFKFKESNSLIVFKNYKSPLIYNNIQSLFQVFII
jgi:hypothetical protein